MPFDSSTRNKLQKMVAACRRILTDEFTAQLQSLYGIQPTGEMADVASMTHLDDEQLTSASLLRERIDHLADGRSADKRAAAEAIDRVIREQAFTVLNRLAALRMCEERGIVQECIGNGFQSRGFQVYCTTAGSGLGDIYQRYRVFLQCLFHEISLDLGVLFDRFSPFGLLFPREPALLETLKALDDNELKEVWKEDEAIGWIYQYFNSKEEREAMRKASAAPRNSRELAVRNQFFTPRYVVEFLTDNTLGRIWYEMTNGETRLKEHCRYLVRRPNEIFLNEGEEPPQVEEDEALGKSQEELLREPVYIPHRPLKDPREIRMLDPACGSMHFGLYAFDLYEHIYEEAWDLFPDLMQDLRENCPTKQEFLKRVPELILRHNIHGIDIDPRACQIAGLSLWLRAQRSYQKLGLKPDERPRITRANVVCAEPMPGEKDLLEEFIGTFRGEQRIVGELVREVWEKMKLAGEAGSLLKIEEERREAIDSVRKEWEDIRRGQPVGQMPMWADLQPPRQLEIRIALGEIKKEAFWDQVEGWVLEALKQFAKNAGNGKGYQRKLFAEDAEQGFAFIDLCRNKYDAVLMNPPFGEFVDQTNHYVNSKYPDTFIDLFATLVERGCLLSRQGFVGAITPRAFLLTKTLERWRIGRIIPDISLLVDMGFGVLDGSTVETCAYILKQMRQESTSIVFDLRNCGGDYQKGLDGFVSNDTDFLRRFIVNTSLFSSLPRARLLYRLNPRFLNYLLKGRRFDPHAGTAKNGLQTYGDERFLRLLWEIDPAKIGKKKKWIPISKGGDFETYFFPIHLVMKYEEDGKECGAVNAADNGQIAQTRRNSEYYYQKALAYPSKSTRGFSVRQLPRDCLFALKGPAIISNDSGNLDYLMGWANSTLIRGLVTAQASTGEYLAGIIQTLPWRQPSQKQIDEIGRITHKILEMKRSLYATIENDAFFTSYSVHVPSPDSISSVVHDIEDIVLEVEAKIDKNSKAINSIIGEIYSCDEVEPDCWDLGDNDHSVQIKKELASREFWSALLVSYAVGNVYGRWDVRIVLDLTLAPKLADPFDPLPVCPPGMLIGPDGLPAKANGIVCEEWLRARPNAIALPPEGSVSRPTLPDEEYPLRISWSGILVDDSNGEETQAHPEDIVHRVREVLDLLWREKAQAIEQEACEILGVTTLREYFRKPTGFFDDHLKRYSKSRRKAPIYWPLSTESGSYTLWIYYHRLTDQTLYQCVNDFVDPKLETVAQDVDKLRGQVLQGGTAKQRDQLERLQKLYQELTDFRAELLRVAALPYRPNLNDGVLITASPLWKLFRLPRWRKELQECWEKLESREYEWAHLAYSIWPDRVREKCRKDKSIAIAHGLEELYEEIAAPKKTKRGKKSV